MNYIYKVNFKRINKDLKRIYKKCKVCKEVKLYTDYRFNPQCIGMRTSTCGKCHKRTIYTRDCTVCGKSYTSSNSKGKYCSIPCRTLGKHEAINGKVDDSWQGGRVTYNCEICGKERNSKLSDYNKGKHHYCGAICQGIGQTMFYSGENSKCWNPSLSKEEREERRAIEGYTQWIKEVFKRDNYKCVYCGVSVGGQLNAHHLNGFKWDIENRLNVDNGVTLCSEHHKDYHSKYGNRHTIKEDFIQWIKYRN